MARRDKIRLILAGGLTLLLAGELLWSWLA
jgi:hypothetical protein